MGSRSRVLSFSASVLSLVSLLAACSSNSIVTVPGKPQPGTYSVDFPSIGAAVASKSVTIYVFSQNDSSAQCVGLLQAVNSGTLSNVASTAVQTITTSACDLGAADAGALAVPYGTYAVLVVTSESQGGTPLLYGCAVPTITADSPSVTIGLRVASNTITIPGTTCAGLQQSCQHLCN